MGCGYDMKPALKLLGWGKKKRHNEFQLIFFSFYVHKRVENVLSHLKEKFNLKFIKPINNQRPDCYIKTDSLASKNLAV